MQRATPPVEPLRRATARRLRGRETEAEVRLWNALRHMSTPGTHFRRQVPIGPYVADFACLAARLVIEVDGAQHGHDRVLPRDAARTRWLEREGYRVLRFWNRDVHTRLRDVVDTVYAALHGGLNAEPRRMSRRRWVEAPDVTPPRHAARVDPPPQGEGGGRGSDGTRRSISSTDVSVTRQSDGAYTLPLRGRVAPKARGGVR